MKTTHPSFSLIIRTGLAALSSLLLATLFAGAVMAEPLQVTVSILPQKYFTERIAGARAEISVMVQPGASPATYEPKPKQMAELSRSGLYLAIGVPFESTWLERIRSANPGMPVVDVSANITKIPMTAHHQHEEMEHDHDAGVAAGPEGRMHAEHEGDHETHEANEGNHHHGGLDPHVWLSPENARILSKDTTVALTKADPDGAPVYAANLKALLADIDALDAEIKDMMKDLPEQRGFLVYHPSWGYFAQAYGLRQVPIETEGKEPSPRELAELVHHAREEGLKTIFVQSQFSERSARTVAEEIGGTVVRLDPLAENWPDNLRRAAKAIADSLHAEAH